MATTLRALKNNNLVKIASNSINTFSLFHTLNFTHQPNYNQNPPSSDTQKTIDGLISIFTKKLSDSKNVELTQLGSKLTPEIVENVLRGIRNWKIAYQFFFWAKTQHGFSHNCYTYNAMASILSAVRQNAPMKALALDLLNSNCYITPGALGFFIRCLGTLGLVKEANLLFDQVKQMGLCVPNTYTYNCLLEVISNSSFSDLAEMRVDEMRGFGWLIDKYTLTPLIRVYCNVGMFDKALSVFNQMWEMGWVDGHVLSILVISFSKWGRVDKAFELIEMIEMIESCTSLRLNEKTYFVLIHGFVQSSRVDKALLLLDKMRKSGLLPDIAVYDVLIGGLCRTQKLDQALDLYSEMKNYGIFPDVGILTKLISSVFEEEIVTQLLQENGQVLDDESLNSLYNSVLTGLVGRGFTDKAFNLLKMMMGDDIQSDTTIEKFFKLKGIVCLDSTSFSIIINALCQNDRLDEALQLFRDMNKIGCQKDVLLCNNLINALCIAGRVVDSLDVLSEMKHSRLQPTQFTYNCIYGYYCRNGDVIGATSVMNEMCLYRHNPWIKNSTTLVKQLCKHQKVAEAANFLSEMVKKCPVPHLIPYTAAIDGFFKIKEVDHALELFLEICSRGYKPDVVAYNILINGLCKAKRMSEAHDVLNQMRAGGLIPSPVTYNSLIDGWCKCDDIDEALVCFSRMAEDHTKPNVITYTTLIDGLCNAARPDDAIKLWNEMEEKMCSPNRITYMALICGLCKDDKPDRAMYYFCEMGNRDLRADSYVYATLLNSLLLNGSSTLALDVLKDMVDKDLFPDPGDKNYALLKDAVAELSNDPSTCSDVNAIIAEGCISSVLALIQPIP